MKNSTKLTSKNKLRVSILTTALFAVLGASNVAMAAKSSAWSCGAWVTDATNSCVETQKCTRTLCDAKGKIDNCRIETKTSTATIENCTPPNAKPRASLFNKGFASQGVMANPSSAKPNLTKPALGVSANKMPNAVIKQPGITKGTIQQPERRAVIQPFPATKTLQPTSKKMVTLPDSKGINTSKTAPTIPSFNTRAHTNETLKTPVIFPGGVQIPTVKNNSDVKKHSALGGAGFVPIPSVGIGSSASNAGDHAVLPEYTGTTPIIKEINIPFAFFASEMQDAFQGTKIHLNNYGPRHGNSWYKGNDSLVELSSALGGVKQQFSFPVKNAFPFRYYMNDVNLASVQVNPSQDRLAIDFNFESSGTEIKGRCSNNPVACVLGSDRAAPDVQMNNATASVYLTPSVRNGSISFSQVTSNFTADIQAQGTCNVPGLSFLCEVITDYKSEIKGAAKQAIQNTVDSDAIRNKIAEKMRLKLVSHGVRDVVSVEVLSNILVIKHRVQQGQMAIQ